MLISLIKYPVTTLGPGNRIGIWTLGCNRNCYNCMAKHTKEFDQSKERSIDSIIEEIIVIKNNKSVDGVTISGGEPFLQKDLNELLSRLRNLGIDDILVYTGYFVEELIDKTEELSKIDVLIDGPYIDNLNDNLPLRGSSNQRIIIFNEDIRNKYDNYLKMPRKYNLEVDGDKLVVIGLLPKGDLKMYENMFGTDDNR